MIIRSYDPMKNKEVVAGTFDKKTAVFTKKVNNRHYMVIEKGYGVSEDVIQQLIKLWCEKIKIVTKFKTYEFGFQELLQKPIKNYRSGQQRFLKV